jgi:hypothetical protein
MNQIAGTAVIRSSQGTFAKRSSVRQRYGWLPLTPRRPRQCTQRYERCGVRAIILPIWLGGIVRKVPRAPPVAFTHRANPLKILEHCRFGLGYLISVRSSAAIRRSKRSAASGPNLANVRSSEADTPTSLAMRSTSSSPKHFSSDAEPLLVQSWYHCKIRATGGQLFCLSRADI